MSQTLYIATPRRIEVVDEPPAELSATQARVEMLYSGISHGTEMNVYRGRTDHSFPRRSGYSAVGRVVEVGPQFEAAAPGDIVFQYAHHGTEFVLDSAAPVYRLPAEMEPRCGVMAALAGVAFNGVQESRIALGDTAVVFGLGVVGLCSVHQLRRAGAFRVIGVDPLALRREAAVIMGADAVINPTDGDIEQQVRDANRGRWADVVLETSGSIAGLNDALRVVCPQSTIVVLSWYSQDAAGLDLARDFHHRRVNIRVAQGDSIPLELANRWDLERRVRSAIELMREMPLAHLVTHTFPFPRAAEAFALVDNHPERCIQVVLEYAAAGGA